MRTKLTEDNPFAHDRWAFAWEHVPRNARAHLDFGCNDGKFLASLASRGVQRCVGVDASTDALAAGRQKHPALEFKQLMGKDPLPFDDATFDSISMLDVLEHLDDQLRVLRDLFRVCKPGGRVIVTVPRQHIFSFLDMGNLKFLVPTLHRWYVCRKHSRDYYQARYAANADGMIGDISAKKRWHEHFTPRKLADLLGEAGFEVAGFDGAGLFTRPLSVGGRLLRPILGKRVEQTVEALKRRDAARWEHCHLFCLARKPA